MNKCPKCKYEVIGDGLYDKHMDGNIIKYYTCMRCNYSTLGDSTMTFKAKYSSYMLTQLGSFYWRTIHANDLTEANKIAKRYTKKGYNLVLLIEEYKLTNKIYNKVN